jgi:hypothetical protein
MEGFMEAKVTTPFKGVRSGEVYPVEFVVGETVTGRLAEVALAEGWAEEVGAKEPVATQPTEQPETKKVPRRGRKS